MQFENIFSNYLNKYLSENSETQENNVCLISGDVLESDFVELPCNHKFNYNHIYREFKNQKNKVNINEIVNLLKNEVKCPYCRTIHKYVLPFNSNYPYDKNIMEKKEKSSKCIAILKSGARKGEICNRKCEKELCYIHRNYIIK